MMTDESLMPYGKYQGEKLANIPAGYLIWMYDNDKLIGSLKKYVEENMAALEKEKYKKDD